MNVGEKICLYKERLKFRNYQEFGRAADVSGDWINELSKKSKIKLTDMDNVVKLCGYLKISIDQLVKDDETESKFVENTDIKDIEDIGFLLNNMVQLLYKEEVKIDNVPMNDKAKQICIDSINVVRTLVKQHL